MLGTRYMKRLSLFATLTSMKLWVLPVSNRMTTLLFFMCHLNFNVCGWCILVMDAIDILGVSSSSEFDEGFSMSCVSSMSDSSLSELSSSSASHWYKFLVVSFFKHLCLGSHFSPQYLHFPSFIRWASKVVLLSLLRRGGWYLVSVLVFWMDFRSLSWFLFHIFFNFSSMIFALRLALSKVDTFSSSISSLICGFGLHT